MKEEMLKVLRKQARELVTEIMGSVTVDAKKYGAEIAKEMASCFVMLYVEKDNNVVKRNLEHLKAQVQLLAVKHQIKMHKIIRERLQKVLVIATKIALTAAIAAV